MKKRILALLLVIAMIFSCLMMLTSCPSNDSGNDGGSNDGGSNDGGNNDDGNNGGNNGGNNDGGNNDGGNNDGGNNDGGNNDGGNGGDDFVLDEGVNGGILGGNTIITDPKDPEAGKGTEDKYTKH